MAVKAFLLRFMHLRTLSAFIVSVALLLALGLNTGCRKDVLTTDSSAKLRFSVDTLTFDTVFTTIASTTLPLKIFNDNKNKIKVSSIELGSGASSKFRINVDGIPGDAYEVEIEGKDSLYIFVEVTVDPNNANNPLIFIDSLNFLTNGNKQKVVLAAWGQDAHFYNGQVICNETWVNDKPYVIFNSMLIDAGCELIIDPGVQIHLSDNSFLYVRGKITANGGCGTDTVSFRGLRLEEFYDDLPGQWPGIFILRGSQNNSFTNVEIKNSTFGLNLGADTTDNLASFTTSNKSSVTLDKVIIKNTLSTGIYSTLSDVTATNCLFYNTTDNLITMGLGGTYVFTNCNFINYGSVTTSHDKPNILMSNVATNEARGQTVFADLNATFKNCIVDGSLDEEIQIEQADEAAFIYRFENCLVKTERTTTPDSFINVLVNVSPQFKNRGEDDFTLLPGSPCIDAGSGFIFDDLECLPRSGTIDIGALEYQP
jgi:hypothetical protein